MKKILLLAMMFVALGFTACSKDESAQYNSDDPSTGKAKAMINGVETYVNWVRLWDGGPKFAEFNLGASAETEYGNYYSYEDAHFNNVASKVWGSGWRIPTKDEIKALKANCDFKWTSVNGVNGVKFTGKDDYKTNSIFLPATGYYITIMGWLSDQGTYGYYWTTGAKEFLRFCNAYCDVFSQSDHTDHLFVRPVLQ